jgi:hypothetical protein
VFGSQKAEQFDPNQTIVDRIIGALNRSVLSIMHQLHAGKLIA